MLISVVLLGIAASLDPLRPVVFALVLRTKRINAFAFLVGWALALSLLFVTVFVAFGGDVSGPASAGSRPWISSAELVVGAALVAIAVRRWQRRAEMAAHSLAPDAILRRLDGLEPRGSGFMGVLIQPRMLTIAAALVIARERSGPLSGLVGFAVFAVVSTAALLGLLVYDIRRPESAESRLDGFVERVEALGPLAITIVFAGVGAYLLVDGLRSLLA